MTCWDQLRETTRYRLNKRDDKRDGMAWRRAAQMFDQIANGRPLGEIEVAA